MVPVPKAVVKRVMDVTLAGTALVLLLPVIAVIAMAIRITMGRPVLFRQLRPGLDGRPFVLIKFRTMRDDRLPDGRLVAIQHRMTTVGRFLRRTSLDELPELWSIVKGDMSLVGPRPLLVEYLAHYTPAQMRRHEVKPGLTGWSQIKGRQTLSWEERFPLDVWYVDHWSPWLDLKILARTLAILAKGEGSGLGITPPPEFTRDLGMADFDNEPSNRSGAL